MGYTSEGGVQASTRAQSKGEKTHGNQRQENSEKIFRQEGKEKEVQVGTLQFFANRGGSGRPDFFMAGLQTRFRYSSSLPPTDAALGTQIDRLLDGLLFVAVGIYDFRHELVVQLKDVGTQLDADIASGTQLGDDDWQAHGCCLRKGWIRPRRRVPPRDDAKRRRWHHVREPSRAGQALSPEALQHRCE